MGQQWIKKEIGVSLKLNPITTSFTKKVIGAGFNKAERSVKMTRTLAMYPLASEPVYTNVFTFANGSIITFADGSGVQHG